MVCGARHCPGFSLISRTGPSAFSLAATLLVIQNLCMASPRDGSLSPFCWQYTTNQSVTYMSPPRPWLPSPMTVSFQVNNRADLDRILARIRPYILEIKTFISSRTLCLNDGCVVITCKQPQIQPVRGTGRWHWLHGCLPSVTSVSSSTGTCMQMKQHISAVCRATYLQLRAIARIRSSLTQSSVAILALSLMISKLDNGNCLLYNLSDRLLHRLQLVQNSAARMVCRVKKNDHISPALRVLHCVPIRQRIKFKILCLVLKHCTVSVMSRNTLWMCRGITNQRDSCDLQARISLSSLCPTTAMATVHLQY